LKISFYVLKKIGVLGDEKKTILKDVLGSHKVYHFQPAIIEVTVKQNDSHFICM